MFPASLHMLGLLTNSVPPTLGTDILDLQKPKTMIYNRNHLHKTMFNTKQLFTLNNYLHKAMICIKQCLH